MNEQMRLVRSRSCRAFLAAASALAALALPASASALNLHVVNESGRPDSEVFVDIAGSPAAGDFVVPGFANDQAKALSEIPGQNVTIERLISGRVYVSYGAPVHEGVTTASPIRYDWAELTVTPVATDAANLTAVNQVGIGMRLTTLGAGGETLETVGSTYANTLFAALQGIPGGPESTVRGANGEILRVLSPDNVPSAYPQLTQYVESMVGKTIVLHTAFFGTPFTTSEYSGTFQPGGAIELTGTLQEFDKEGNPLTKKPKTGGKITITGPELLEDIYTGGTGENDLEFAIRRDLYSGFSAGLWGSKYGDGLDASAFCTNYNTTKTQGYCERFNVPAFAEARTVPAPFPAYEQYAAVINELTDIYGNPFSDASKNVHVALDQPHVQTLQLSILPDSPPSPAPPASSGGSSGSASAKPPTVAPTKPKLPQSNDTFRLKKTAKFEHGKIAVGKVVCDGPCGKVVALLSPAKGKGLIARQITTFKTKTGTLVLKPTGKGKSLLSGKGVLRAKLSLTATQPGHAPVTRQVPLKVMH
jgi:hypothetical protein